MGLAKLTVGKSQENGNLAHIDSVERGLACNCVCPKCKAQLVARKGELTAHHFAHHNAEECEGAWESALHLYAKQVLVEQAEITLPPICVSRKHRQDVQVQDAQVYEFSSIELEKSYGSFQPDAVITAPYKLFIEFAVTHFAEEEKIAKLAKHGVSTVEVDLSKAEHDFEDSQLRDFIINTAPRQWLYSVKAEAELKKLDEQEKADAYKAAQEEIRRAKERERAYEAEMALAFKEMLEIISSEFRSIGEVTEYRWNPLNEVSKLGLSTLCNYQPSTPDVFFVEPKAWQSAIIYAFVIKAIREDRHTDSKFSASVVFHWLHQRGFLPKLFSRYYDVPYLMEYANSFGDYGKGPYKDVVEYLDYLVTRRLLWKDREGSYRISKFHAVLGKLGKATNNN